MRANKIVKIEQAFLAFGWGLVRGVTAGVGKRNGMKAMDDMDIKKIKKQMEGEEE